MGLDFGWRAHDTRRTIWMEDPALDGVTEAARAEFLKDGDACHLRPYVKNGEPTEFTFRTLNLTERDYVEGIREEGGPGWAKRFMSACFRIGVSFDAAEEGVMPASGRRRTRMVEEHGIQMLDQDFVDHLERRYPMIVMFYGAKIWTGTVPSEQEKKALSPSSTPRPSSEAASTAGSTAAASAGGAPAA